jgi:hypothetical protein
LETAEEAGGRLWLRKAIYIERDLNFEDIKMVPSCGDGQGRYRGEQMDEKEQIINRLFALENKIMAPYVYPVWYENWIKNWMIKYLSLKELIEMRKDLRRYCRQKELNG